MWYLSNMPCIISIPKIKFPLWLSGKESTCNAGDTSLGQKDPLEKEIATNSSILAWKIPWWAVVHGVTKVRAQTINSLTFVCL